MSFIMRPIRFASGSTHIIEGSGLFDGSSGYLSRTPTSASNRTTWTFHVIAKRFNSSADHQLFEAGSSSGTRNFIQYNSAGKATIASRGPTTQLDSAALFRDPSAWHDLLFVWDTSDSTAANRVKIYSNGVRLTDLATDTQATSSLNSIVNTVIIHTIGRASWSAANFGNYALARVALIDGLALTPSSFGETTDDGYWQINDISGLTFGTNGFLLEGSNGLSNYPIATADMTGASAPSGDVTSSAENSGELNWHAFDRDAATYWNANDGGVASLTYHFDSTKTIASYSIQNRSGGTNGHPENWTIQGSNNGSDFTTLDTQTGQDFSASTILYYTFKNATAYSYYRLNVTESQADEGPIVAEWAMYETQDLSGNGAGFLKSGTITATNDSPTNGDAE